MSDTLNLLCFKHGIMRMLLKCPNLFSELRFWYWLYILKSGLKNERELSVLPGLVAPGITAIDVGAHCGRYTLPLSTMVGENGCVCSFEPVTANYRILKRLKKLHQLNNVVLYNLALGERTGTGVMNTPVTDQGLYNFSCSTVSSDDKVDTPDHLKQEVEIVTLDSIFFGETYPAVGYIKCDVEGYELFVLHGGENILRMHKPIVQCEIVEGQTLPYGYSPEDLVSFMSNMGYNLNAYDGSTIRSCEISPSFYNYFFIPKSTGHLSF